MAAQRHLIIPPQALGNDGAAAPYNTPQALGNGGAAACGDEGGGGVSGVTYDVQYDDGDFEEEVPLERVLSVENESGTWEYLVIGPEEVRLEQMWMAFSGLAHRASCDATSLLTAPGHAPPFWCLVAGVGHAPQRPAAPVVAQLGALCRLRRRRRHRRPARRRGRRAAQRGAGAVRQA